MTSRSKRRQTAEETVAILRSGNYQTADRKTVDLSESLRSAWNGSRHITPGDFRRLPDLRPRPEPTRFEVRNETTLAAARRMIEEGETRVLVLNFASAKNPGGGFLSGSQAQEESLARATGLYACLMRFPEFYEANRRGESCLYSDHMIYSPDVPVFRGDDDELLAVPFLASILTSPAVNAGAVRQNEPDNEPQIELVMRSRILKVLQLAVHEGHTSLVLGAWGCGVFKNSPVDVALWFAESLRTGPYRDVFRRVTFAVLDRSVDGQSIRPFELAILAPA